MAAKKTIRVLLLLAAVVASQLTLAQDMAIDTNNCAPGGNLRGNAESGQVVHLEYCAQCHGHDGKAEVIVMHMDEMPRDQTDATYMSTLNDQFLYLAICGGGEAIGKSLVMPAWGDTLTDQEIRDLVAWIRTFAAT
ncbi:MAG: c-type cytochrome [Gammaproteobacteria bacterium]|nr:c-type cytochrome [Gammaproteobacteria bacterium]